MEILTEWSSIYCLVKKCYTVYNTLLILSSMHVTWANLSTENIIFLDFCCCCNANLYYRMADKLSKGSNSSTFKNVWIDIGVIGMQGKGKTRKTVILTKTNNNKQNKTKRTHKKHTIKTYLKKKVLCQFLIRLNCTCRICLPPKKTLYLNREHGIICLLFIQPGACSARYWLVSAQQSRPIRKQNHRKGINFYRCFDLLLHASFNNMLSKQCNRES